MTSLNQICSRRLLVLFACAAFSASTTPAAAENLSLSADLPLAGSVSDIRDQTSAMGFTFNVRFSEISYEGQMHRLLVVQQDENKMRIKVALRDVQLFVKQTQIRGSRHSADCGPICLTLGTARDLWIEFQVERTAHDRLKLVDATFQLTADNWRVGSPAWVRTQGLGMSESRVVSGLRSGLAANTKTIERKLVDELPTIFAQVEQRLSQQLNSDELAAN